MGFFCGRGLFCCWGWFELCQDEGVICFNGKVFWKGEDMKEVVVYYLFGRIEDVSLVFFVGLDYLWILRFVRFFGIFVVEVVSVLNLEDVEDLKVCIVQIGELQLVIVLMYEIEG